MVVIESFELSQHIAACAYPIKNKEHAVREGCNADVPTLIDPINGLPVEDMFYTSIVSTCRTDGEKYYCYTKNASETFVFSS